MNGKKKKKILVIKRNQENYPVVRLSFLENKIPDGSIIKSLNGVDLSKIEDKEIIKLQKSSKKTLIEVFGISEKITIEPEKYELLNFNIDFSINSIIEINTMEGFFELDYIYWSTYKRNDWKEEGKTSRRVFMSDMARGGISYFDLDKKTYTQVFKVRHPSHFDIVDLNKDGLMDLVVSDLGMLMTVTTKEGKIYWFENQGKGKFKKHVLAKNLGRCADVRAGDFDKDGDIDAKDLKTLRLKEDGWDEPHV